MTPLLRVTLAFLAGLVPGLLQLPFSIAVGATLAGVGAFVRARHAWLLFAGIGALAGLGAVRHAERACAAQWQHRERVTVVGYVSALPQPGRAVAFAMRAPCRGEIRTTLPRGRAVVPGEPVRIAGQWQRFEPRTRWPTPAARTGVLFARTAVALDSGPRAGPLVRGRIAAQHAFRAALPRTHGVAEALVLAQRDGLDPAVRDAFVAAGLAHLLAISGSHVLIFAGMLLLLLRVLRVPLRAAGLSAAVIMALYVVALGLPPPAARAALQFALVTSAVLLQRPAHAWTLLAAAALALLVAEPLVVLDVGFQLSFAGVAGLLAYRRRLGDALPRQLPKFLREGMSTGIAATLATAPIAALHFGQFAPIGLVATIVAGPLLALALPALVLLLCGALVAPAAVPWIAPGTELLLGALLRVARAAAHVPGGHFAVDAATLQALLAAVLLAMLWHARRRRPEPAAATPESLERRRRLKLLWRVRTAAGMMALLAWLPAFSPRRAALEVHAIDVGQGDALAVRTPRGRWLLVDAGVRSDRSDMGARRVVPYLLARGVRRIDALILTHAHADHIGGALAVFAAFEVGTVIDPGAPGASRQYVETLRAAAAEPARWLAPGSGEELRIDGVHVRFLYPDSALLDAPDDPNDFSVVFRLGFGRFGALFLGDAPQAVEERLVAEHGRELAAAVLKVGHHGSRTSTGDSLLAVVAPRVALVSVGRDNRYGHPGPDVLARLLRHGALVLRTDEHGSIRVRAWRSGRIELATQR